MSSFENGLQSSGRHTDATVDDNEAEAIWITCYLGLGSNLANELGSPVEHLQQAITSMQAHKNIRDVRVSSYYASAPMGPQDQPDFVNAVVGFETTLTAFELLTFCQQLEELAKRARIRRWGERSLDVDILLYGEAHVSEPQLTIPHVGLTERNFVLIPLRELSPNLIITGMSIGDYPQSTDWKGLKLLLSSD